MSTTQVNTPTSRLRLGYARRDITPPVGIYHRMWGAARHDAATGVHRPLHIDVLILEPLVGNPDERHVRVQTDFVHLNNEQREALVAPVAAAASVPAERVVVTHSHSHSAGFFEANRQSMPGGHLISPYLQDVSQRAAEATSEALANLADASISYGAGRCDMASNRDYWDTENGLYTTGHNPDRTIENRLSVARVTDGDGALRLLIVHYACHPTTLAWDNTLISPDFVGALREVIEADQDAPCCFFQAPCGDLGPREGFVGDTDVADRNGKQVGHAALSVLYGMGLPQHDFAYAGPVISGATIGTWTWRAHGEERQQQSARFSAAYSTVDLPLIALPSAEQLQDQLAEFTRAQDQADEQGDPIAARDLGARAERCRRWLGRITRLPEDGTFPFHFSLHVLGDAVWVTTGAEPYSWLAEALRRRFPALFLLISPIAGDTQVAYLLTRDSYGTGLYQQEPSSLDQGCLEQLIDALTEEIAELTGHAPIY